MKLGMGLGTGVLLVLGRCFLKDSYVVAVVNIECIKLACLSYCGWRFTLFSLLVA